VLDYLLQYGLFLAEVTTVVIAIGVVIGLLFKTIRHMWTSDNRGRRLIRR
jgi:hypothetical protein